MSKLYGNTTYIMLSTAIVYISIFYRFAKKEKLCAPFQPTVAYWNFARHLCDRLGLFFDISELLSGTTHYRKHQIYRVFLRLPSVFLRALGKQILYRVLY